METPAHLRMGPIFGWISLASAFQDTWNKTEESHSYRRAYKAGICRLRFSFFANDFDLRSRAVPQPFGLLALREGAAQAATAGRPELDDVVLFLVSTGRGLRACSSVG
jgi:hypothetical protein